MVTEPMYELYEWARRQVGKPVMLRYHLYKVNGQTPGQVALLLREFNAWRAGAEIEVSYDPVKILPYQAVFTVLPASADSVVPPRSRPSFATQQEVIDWVKTGLA